MWVLLNWVELVIKKKLIFINLICFKVFGCFLLNCDTFVGTLILGQQCFGSTLIKVILKAKNFQLFFSSHAVISGVQFLLGIVSCSIAKDFLILFLQVNKNDNSSFIMELYNFQGTRKIPSLNRLYSSKFAESAILFF